MTYTAEPIAIVGSSCRLPGGSSSPSRLWSLLQDPKDCLNEIPSTRFDPRGFYHVDGEYHGSTNVRHSYLLEEDFREFDNNFFNIHPKEAESMDPQQRILLEVVFEGIEAAGYSIQQLQGSQTAVFVGQMTQDYADLLLRDVDSAPQYAATGVSRAILSNRVSYFFDWKGPSSTIDTACSSSLVALHHAVQTLRSGESSMAVAAGANLLLGPEQYIYESKLHMLSPTGRSRMWDASADGYARGEGFASVILKTLSQAVADGDHIECIVRETGVNQDGRTSGITMPSSTAQTALIRSTYTRAGLDWRKKQDRCQYFEAHGTGTQAGDPIEARAVRDAFFPEPEDDDDEEEEEKEEEEEPLYVGSVKTIIGHLEGTAGLAGLLKASLAIQQGIIPPNMHFNNLNPKIRPFYSRLKVPTEARPWPALPPGIPRRASVNSFGFGGTNAHAIIESWTPETTSTTTEAVGPITLSARTERALLARARSLSEALRSGQVTDVANLAWTLQSRRTQFPHKMYVSSSTVPGLIKRLDDAASQTSSSAKAIHVTQDLPSRILGVFTGQGAQWASMGRRLYEKSFLFRKTIGELQDSLSMLPDPPSWSLTDQLLASADTSRIDEAAISQPLCTALQVALVDLLAASGITFSAVVGHSSGEIAAAYAAGYIKASDAIRIAYYRGALAHLAAGPQGQKGKMMAVGMSLAQARAFCEQNQFAGRLHVAASNSGSSVTLSGDGDAVDEAKELLDGQKTFARVLKVDKAYHSHHMQACAGAYLEALRRLDIQINTGELRCMWYSSVHGSNGRSVDDTDAFKDIYWVDNMVQPVLFSQAIERAVTEEHCHDVVLEVGPHHALKAPASETLKNLTGLDLPYSGVLRRGADDMEAFSDALGFIWSSFHSPTPVVDFPGFWRACLGDSFTQGTTLKGLPPYPWEHDSKLLRESRRSRRWRTRKDPVHELLGHATSHGDGRDVSWRHVMRIQEMEWLRGHVFQGQVLFPAAGYVSMAYEASKRLATAPIRLVELQDLVIHRAITLEDDSAGTEVTFTIRVLDRSPNRITAEYSCYSCRVDGDAADFPESTNFTGRATVHLGLPAADTLPARIAPKLPMKPVSVDRLYTYAEKIGLRYTGDFRVQSVERRLNLSTVTLKQSGTPTLPLHPATLDAAFHGIFTALGFPGDGRLWAPYLPTQVRRVRINPAALEASAEEAAELIADAHLRDADSKKICGDVDITSSAIGHPLIQVHALTMSSFTKATPQNDRRLFAKTIWRRDIGSGIEPERLSRLTEEEVEYVEMCERLAYFYLRRLRDKISLDEVHKLEGDAQRRLDWILNHLLPRIESGHHPRIKREWASDSPQDALTWRSKHPGVEMQLITALGEAQSSILCGDVPQDDMLARYHAEAIHFRHSGQRLAAVAGQLAHRHPRMKVLEIGAGMGHASIHILGALAGHCHSYTYTDLSDAVFEAARERLGEYSALVKWATFNIDRDPLEQGFQEHSFDLVVSSNALQAESLAQALAHCRSLLRPGGFLILNETTNDALLPQFIESHLPGWGMYPTVDETRWNEELLSAGFSGVDAHDPTSHVSSLIISQAIDDRVELLRSPFSRTDSPSVPHIQHLLIVGRASQAQALEAIFHPLAPKITLLKTLDDAPGRVPAGSAVLVLSELDVPTFQDITPQRFSGVQAIFQDAKYVLWITQGCRAENPVSNMIVGLGRSVMHEQPNLRLQFLDVDSKDTDPLLFAESLLRTILLDSDEFEGVMWADEWELAIEAGALHVPRIYPNEAMNNRFNAERREIISPLSVSGEDCVELLMDAHGVGSLQTVQQATASGIASVQVQTQVSSLLPLRAQDNKPCFLCVGSVEDGSKVVVLSPSSRSTLSIPQADLIRLPDSFDASVDTEVLLGHLIAEIIVHGSHDRIWVHDADALLARLIASTAAVRGVQVFFSTSSEVVAKSEPIQTFLHPYSTDRDVEAIIPASLQLFVNLGGESIGALDAIIKRLETKGLRRMHAVRDNVIQLSFNKQELLDIVTRFAARPGAILRGGYRHGAIALSEITSGHSFPDPSPTATIDWSSLESINTKVRPLDASTLFSGDKSYLLVGLASDLGMSLCEWMIAHGARHLAITSRNPGRVDSQAVEDLKRRGASIRMFPLDISEKKRLLEVYEEMLETMPPIAGVANAAMVLNDKMFSNMSLADFEVALVPKVNGTRNLDDIFHSHPLDFFICFSSLTCLMGNPGQSNYAAANMFMHSLTRQRRERGVASSIIDISFLLGLGVAARGLEQFEEHLTRSGYMKMSEVEIHVAFAEAIAAGKPTSGEDPEILTGIGEVPGAPWYRDPRFSTYIRHEDDGDDADSNAHDGSLQTVQGRLASAKDGQEALDVLQGAFAAKLAAILHVQNDSVDYTSPLLMLGIDSLVAVEIRSWFLKEIGVDMAVLKILSGASLVDICQDALVMLPSSLTSSVSSSASETAAETNETRTEEDSITSISESSTRPSSVSEVRVETSSGRSFQRISDMALGQSRLYFLHVYLEDKTTYNVTMSGKLQGPLDINRLERALGAIVAKHEALRTSFFLDASGKALQGVGRDSCVALQHGAIRDDAEAEIREAVHAMQVFEFDLEAGPWMKVDVLSKSRNEHQIIIGYHHIALDGVGLSVFLDELNKAYVGASLGKTQQAIDLSDKHRREAAPDNIEKELNFWKNTYDSLPEPLPLFPVARVPFRKLLKSYDTETLHHTVHKNQVLQIKRASAELQVTPFHFYLSSIAAFVSKCLKVDDFSIGVLDANRKTAEDMTTIGCFINTIPLRFRMKDGERFDELARRTRNNALAALSNSNADFDAILDALKVSRSGEQSPLFQIAVNYRLNGLTNVPLGEGEIEWTSATDARNPYDLIIDITAMAEETIISFTTQSYLYDAADTDTLLSWYARTLQGFAGNTSRLALDCSLASEADIQHALSLGRGDRLDMDWKDPTLAHRVAGMADLNPESIAVKDGYGVQLTYSEMMQRVSQIANELRNLPSGSFVGIVLNPTVDTICSIMAILTAGLIYVPLDLKNPEGRLTAIVTDCKPSALICHAETLELAQKLAKSAVSPLFLVNVSVLEPHDLHPFNCLAQAHAPGFAIYTSGSTGTPKGVLLTHASVLNQIWAISKLWDVGKEVVLQQSSLGFDLSLEQIFIALANGGTLIVASKAARGDALEIAKLMASERVTYTVFVPSEYSYLLHYGSSMLKGCASWRFAFSGGEKVTAPLRQAFKRLDIPGLRLINLYGPAEASLSCTRCDIFYRTDESEGASPAGRAMPNYSLIVVDENGKPLPVGFPGEICIGGAGNAAGYLNRPQETAAKFIQDKISPAEDIAKGWTKLYRTGDKGRMLESGLLQFIGRIEGDSQVKIRGMRMELEEIARIIIDSSRSAIADAAVSLRGNDILVAFVVFSQGFVAEDKASFLQQLKVSLPLPTYMCPAYIIAVADIPRNPSGKKDRFKINSLPIPRSNEEQERWQAEDLTEMEEQVCAVWRDILPAAATTPRFTADTDFFFVGGNSLLLLKLRTELKMAFGCHLSLPDLFQASTIRDMALKIGKVSPPGVQNQQNIVWNEELRSLGDGFGQATVRPPADPSTSSLCVVLTGATGFLGRHILQCLVDDERVGKVHCIAIRPGGNGEPRHVDVSSPKVVEHQGDLSDHQLGLKPAEMEHLTAHADIIIHNGADVSFMKTYRSLRRSNVLSTQRLAEMAIRAGIPLHFVSTASVTDFYPGEALPEVSVQALPQLPPDGRQGYAISKCVSEALLENLANEHNLQSWIHRPTSITGRGAPQTDVVASLYGYSKRLGAVPRFPEAFSGAFDFVAVETVALDIVTAAIASSIAPARSSISYTNHCGRDKVLPHGLAAHLQQVEGGEFVQVELSEWLHRAQEAGLDGLVREYLESVMTGEPLALPSLIKGVGKVDLN